MKPPFANMLLGICFHCLWLVFLLSVCVAYIHIIQILLHGSVYCVAFAHILFFDFYRFNAREMLTLGGLLPSLLICLFAHWTDVFVPSFSASRSDSCRWLLLCFSRTSRRVLEFIARSSEVKPHQEKQQHNALDLTFTCY
jgi:hypothetical protein